MLWHSHHMPDTPFFPFTVEAVMEHLAARVEENCGHTVPQKIVYTVGAVTKLFEMKPIVLTTSLIQVLVQGHLKTRTSGTRQAVPLSVNMLMMLERGFHLHKKDNDATAIICGIWLFLVNTSMRFSDSGWINPWTMRFGEVQTKKGTETVLRGRCSKARSDQLGIRSQFSCPNFFLTSPWLEEWYEIYMLYPHEQADFLFPSVTMKGTPKRIREDFSRPADFKDALIASKAISRNLCKELGMNLADDIRNITFHSCRATMVDLSAAAGCSIAAMLT